MLDVRITSCCYFFSCRATLYLVLSVCLSVRLCVRVRVRVFQTIRAIICPKYHSTTRLGITFWKFYCKNQFQKAFNLSDGLQEMLVEY